MSIADVHAHLLAGHEVAIVTYTRIQVLTHRHIAYIRQDPDERGYRLGWPGRSSVYAFADQVRLVPPGTTLIQRRPRKKAMR